MQRVEILGFEPDQLPSLLHLPRPKFAVDDRHLTQFRTVVSFAATLGCKSVLIEEHYVDRDFMEDHSVFYSKNLRSFPNYCHRLHFFTLPASELAESLSNLRRVASESGPQRFHFECNGFSEQAYLGFMVLKPLPGAPVGRTVLRPPIGNSETLDIKFPCRRRVTVHVCGVVLQVDGLAFQQQDMGVSACATTALWSSFGMMRHTEDFGASTPAQITALAAKHSLPFGRAFPSEGLSIDQMCQAVQAVSLSPNLFRVSSPELTLSYLYASTKSGVAPILVLKSGKNSLEYHAVCIAGMGLGRDEPSSDTTSDRAKRIQQIYIHDDRYGPYLEAKLVVDASHVDLSIKPAETPLETWRITHILIPMPPKVRLSFSSLRELARIIATNARAFALAQLVPEEGLVGDPSVQFETWISRSHVYLESLLWGFSEESRFERCATLAQTVALSRYLGVVRLRGSFLGVVDVLIDTTSTRKNPNCLAIVVRDTTGHTVRLAEFLASEYGCAMVG